MGDFLVEENTGGKNLETIMSEVLQISSRSWKGKIHSDISKSEENKNFFLKLSKIAAKNGWLSIWLLKINGKAIAMEYHLKYKKKIYALRGDFDESYGYCSPGGVLDYSIIKYVFENDFLEYDMCGGASAYKMRWGARVREHSIFCIFNDTMYSYLLYIIEIRLIDFLRKIRIVRVLKNFCGKILCGVQNEK